MRGTRSPQWTHGGIALGPKPRKYHIALNKKTKKVAMISALSSKVIAEEIIVVDSITPLTNEKNGTQFSTKGMVAFLNAVGAAGKTLVVLPNAIDCEDAEKAAAAQKLIVKSFANIEGVKTTPCGAVNVYDILNCGKMVIAKDAILKIQEVYTR